MVLVALLPFLVTIVQEASEACSTFLSKPPFSHPDKCIATILLKRVFLSGGWADVAAAVFTIFTVSGDFQML